MPSTLAAQKSWELVAAGNFAVADGRSKLEARELASIAAGDIPESSSPQAAETEKPANVGES